MATYEQTLLVYLDIMGFKDMIEESIADPTKVDLIRQTLRRMRLQTEIQMPGALRTKTRSQNFSDLIVRANTPGEQWCTNKSGARQMLGIERAVSN